MYFLAGTVWERPQEGHVWNRRFMHREDVEHLDRNLMAYCDGSPRAGHKTLCHMPIFGGWRDYVVLEPCTWSEGWHIGFITHVIGVRRIVVRGPVRMLRTPGPTLFFGIAAEGDRRHEQIAIRQIGEGRIGQGGPFASLPILSLLSFIA